MNSTPSDTSTTRRPHRRCKAARTILWILGSLLLVVAALLAGATLWLSPGNLSRLVAREASEYLKAEVKVVNPRFTFWSSFPWLTFQTDSIIVESTALDSLPEASRKRLPQGWRHLLSARSACGEINIAKALRSRYFLRNFRIDDLSLNLVALNDSAANYLILPSSGKEKRKIPFLSIDSLKLNGPYRISYYSSEDSVKALVISDNSTLIRDRGSECDYRLSIPGKITLGYGQIQLLRDFPFSLDSRVALAFHPFSCRFSDAEVAFGEIHGKINLDILAGDNPAISKFNYSLASFNLGSLMKSFPILKRISGISPTLFAGIQAFSSDIDVNLSGHIVGPYHLSASALPDASIQCEIAPGKSFIHISDRPSIPLSHGPIRARFLFNGKNPKLSRLDMDPFSLQAPGIICRVDADVTDLMTTPGIMANVTSRVDLSKLPDLSAFFSNMNLCGNAEIRSKLAMQLTDFDSDRLLAKAEALRIEGETVISDLHGYLPSSGLAIDSRSMKLSFKNDPSGLSVTGVADGVDLQSSPDTLRFRFGKILLATTLPYSSGLSSPDYEASLACSDFSIDSPEMSYAGNSLGIKADYREDVSPSEKGLPLPEFSTSAEEARLLATQAHTPEFLQLSLPEHLRELIDNSDLHLDIEADGGIFKTRAFSVANYLQKLSASLSNDSIHIRRLDLRTQGTGLHVSGTVSNLRQWLTSPRPAILKADMDVAFDTIQINRLARAYVSGQIPTRKMASSVPAKRKAADSDTVALLLPRNLETDIRLSADATVYMNLHLYDLFTHISTSRGNLNINDLDISSSFAHANADIAYDSSEIQNLGVDAEVALTQLNIVEFFKNFPTLLTMMPQMKNLSGMLSASVKGNMQMFPDMYINVPALNADIDLLGRGLTVHQNKFIRHITRMMLIRSDSDLKIADMDVHASVHDNLLELDPFNFEFANYKLSMEGLNNFNGNLLYHIGILKSPLHIPFGIDIKGNFSHPKLRFGKATFKPKGADFITTDIMESKRINMVSELKYYLKLFIEKAAHSDNSGQLFNVPMK